VTTAILIGLSVSITTGIVISVLVLLSNRGKS